MGHKKQSKNVQEQNHQGTSTGVQESVKISTVVWKPGSQKRAKKDRTNFNGHSRQEFMCLSVV